VLNVKINL